MAWIALNCPQCSAPLPRVALWRSVKCGSCGSLITRTESMVMRDTFRQAWKRAHQGSTFHGELIRCGGQAYRSMQLLGRGEISQVHLARRTGPLPCLATIKLSSARTAAERYAREAEVLRALQDASGNAAGSYFSQRLPEVVAVGPVEDTDGQQALVLRHPSGHWGSLAALGDHCAQGLDPRHGVWIWRRMLEVLSFVHSRGWLHGDIRPEHALVHPKDHGVRLIGWASAQRNADPAAQAVDLVRSARVIQALLGGETSAGGVAGTVPPELSALLSQAGEDIDFCRQQGASGLDAQLRSAASAAFGPPRFVHLQL